ncbi:MAG: DUF2244 domain-containing protein [Parvibaculum sp.]|uniref:DUF2244 domain-containing protein n=1 Tax=Parvibaculum sp. TaxID=2024848 RepID=UPI0025DE1FC2|nr:DUF2244 domain-containing protein [Parvibaculum sp.]MCE9648107.1 DUF2244 domain-containing protein [Parvibaculum sp.]
MDRTPDAKPLDAKLEGALHFNAVVTPHRSLGRKGFIVLMSVLVAVNFTAGMIFLLKGAWPIFGFCGLDVALVYWAFKANYRAARAHETVQLSDDELLIRRVDQRGNARAFSFQPYWVRLDLVENPDESTELYLRSHGKSLELARVLSPPERLQFARALQAALRKVK